MGMFVDIFFIINWYMKVQTTVGSTYRLCDTKALEDPLPVTYFLQIGSNTYFSPFPNDITTNLPRG